jgi:hypothetical protein
MTLLPFGKGILAWGVIAAIAYGAASQYGAISLGVLAAVPTNRTADWYRGRPATTALPLIAAVSGAAMIYPSIYSLRSPAACGLRGFAMRKAVATQCCNAVARWDFVSFLPECMHGKFFLHFIEKKLPLDGGGYWLGVEFMAGVVARE